MIMIIIIIIKFGFRPLQSFQDKEAGTVKARGDGLMSIAVFGGLDRLKRIYEKTGKDFGCRVRVFAQRVPGMSKRLRMIDGIVLFTGTISHNMVKEVVSLAKLNNIPVSRSHTSSASGLKRCLGDLAPVGGRE